MELKNRSFQYGKVALAVRAQYNQLQFVLTVVAICTDICMSLVQTVRSLLLPDFLSVDNVASICRRSRSSDEQDQSLSWNSSNNFLALQPLLCLKTFISIPSSLIKTIAFDVNQTRHKNVTSITSLFVTLSAVTILNRYFPYWKILFKVHFLKSCCQKPCGGFCWNLQRLCQKGAIIKVAKRKINSDKICRSYSDLNFGVTFWNTV